MPGKHAPSSPASFYWSLTRAAAGALAVLGLVVAIAVVAVNSRGSDDLAAGTPTAPATPTAGTETSPSPAPETSSPKPSPTLRPRSEVTVVVLNGAGVQGLAASVSQRLEKDGYDLATPGNAPRTDTTAVYFRKGAKADAEALRRLRFRFVDRVRKAPANLPDDVLVIVVLGRDYPA